MNPLDKKIEKLQQQSQNAQTHVTMIRKNFWIISELRTNKRIHQHISNNQNNFRALFFEELFTQLVQKFFVDVYKVIDKNSEIRISWFLNKLKTSDIKEVLEKNFCIIQEPLWLNKTPPSPEFVKRYKEMRYKEQQNIFRREYDLLLLLSSDFGDDPKWNPEASTNLFVQLLCKYRTYVAHYRTKEIIESTTLEDIDTFLKTVEDVYNTINLLTRNATMIRDSKTGLSNLDEEWVEQALLPDSYGYGKWTRTWELNHLRPTRRQGIK